MPKQSFYSWIVNGCTSLNLILGLCTVLLSCHGYCGWAALCLLGSVVWDAADGFLARRWEVASEFGAQLDSLADMTSFSVGGAVFVYGWLKPSVELWALVPLACWCALTGAWRLARFNATPRSCGEFYGLPTTAVATLLAVGYLTCPLISCIWLVSGVALVATLMISPLPYPKFTRIVELPRWLWLALPLAGLFHLQWTVWLCAGFYLLTGPAIWLQRRCKPDLGVPS